MSPSRIGLVLAKELRETLRDRRTLMVMLLVPLVVYPLIGIAMVQVLAGRTKGRPRTRRASRVAGRRRQGSEAVRKMCSARPPTSRCSRAAARTTWRPGDVDAVVLVNAPAGGGHARARRSSTTRRTRTR